MPSTPPGKRCVVLGWGSLVWFTGGLRLCSEWVLGGPTLPIEFSRVSRDRRLTLVVDLKHGVSVPTWFAECDVDTLEANLPSFAERENATVDRVGWVDVTVERDSLADYPDQAGIHDRVAAWCRENRRERAIWTAHPSNFSRKLGRPFSPEAALEYVEGLPAGPRAATIEYFCRAPKTTRTPTRALFEERFPGVCAEFQARSG